MSGASASGHAVDLRNADAVMALFEAAAKQMLASSLRRGCVVRLPARGRLLITGDLHDNPLHLQKIVRLAALDQSNDHHVVLHEIIHSERLINGMDFSHRMLARVAELVLAYPAQVHPLLANHELAQLTGKGISKGAGNSVELFNDGLEFAFGEEWEEVLGAIRQFIGAMPLALVSESGVLCAHSLPPPHLMHRFDAEVLARALEPADYQSPFGAAHLMTWGRGHTAEQIAALAAKWNIALFCLGHEHVDAGVEMKHERLLVLNSDHERGVALPIDLVNPPRAEDALLSAISLATIG